MPFKMATSRSTQEQWFLTEEDECITTRHNNTSATFLTEDGLYQMKMKRFVTLFIPLKAKVLNKHIRLKYNHA